MKTVSAICFSALAVCALPALAGQESVQPGMPAGNGKVQKIRFVEDDAQNCMVSKIYELKHQKANDLVPFVLGAVKRCAKNSTADRINYSAGNKQLIAVSCPAFLMPYIDDMIARLDRPGKKGPDGSGIDGTGIVRNVYTPVWRSGETMVKVMIKAGIPSNAAEGANQDAVVALDAATNRIYWKDSINKDKDLKKYLAWLDRPVPQCTVSLQVYEVRESDLLDLGLDYLAWKNGPGLNLFDAGANFLEGSALEHTFGPYGFFMFAPAFDLSFVRVLQQNGKAKIATSASLTLVTGQDAELHFAPGFQNLVKSEKFASSVETSANDLLALKIKSPVIALGGAADPKTGRLPCAEKDYVNGTLDFSYELAVRNVVERDNHGNELYESTAETGAVTVRAGIERLISRYVGETETEQTIGVPFLCELPVLKYIFGTTTRSKEKVFRFVSVRAELRHPDSDIAAVTGHLMPVSELVNPQQKGK